MNRLFLTSTQRRQTYLNGRWQFVIDPEDEGKSKMYYKHFPQETAEEMYVPCAWNSFSKYYYYEGITWYKKAFFMHETKPVKLSFLGVAHNAEVYLDGVFLGKHSGGFTPFSFSLPEVSRGKHELILKVDNIHTNKTIPKTWVDWYHYGGITRDVLLEEVSTVFIDGVKFEYTLDGNLAHVKANVEIVSMDDSINKQDVKILIQDEVVAQRDVFLTGEITGVEMNFTMEKVELWSMDSPTLYTVAVQIDEDDYIDRIGFRSISVENTDVLLNGKPIEINGINRHEDHPEWGFGLPARLMKKDIDLIKEAGLNGVRLAHYPCHPVFLDYCDEEGLLVMEEIPYWQYSKEDFMDPHLLDKGKKMLIEMIDRDYNHPSIITWGMHNECDTNEPELYKITRELTSLARQMDGSRLITYASDRAFRLLEDICIDLIDIVYANAYWGWYRKDMSWNDYFDKLHEATPNKPIIISEFGAGAVYGERTFEKQLWSEGYQADLITQTIKEMKSKDYIAGFFIWQFCDTKTAHEKALNKPKTTNNKGILDVYRRPKEAYYAVADMLRGKEDR